MNTKLSNLYANGLINRACRLCFLLSITFINFSLPCQAETYPSAKVDVQGAGASDQELRDSIFFQGQWIVFKDYPEKIPYLDAVEAMHEADSLVLLGENKSNHHKQVLLQYFKGQLSLQLGEKLVATEAYQKGMALLDEKDISSLRIRFLTGMGELALSQEIDQGANSGNSVEYFEKALQLSREIEFASGLTWIFYHNGGRFFGPDDYSKEEIKAVVDYADRALYSNPTKALELSNWLIENGSEYPIHEWDGLMVAGLVYRDWGEFHKALELFDRARVVSEQSIEENRPLFMAMLNTAAVFSMQDQLEQSLKLTMEVVDIAKERGELQSVAYGLKDIGLTYKDMEDYEKTEQYLLEAIEAMKVIDNEQGVAICEVNLGSMYIDLDQPYKSIAYLEKAMPVLKATGYDLLYAGSLISKAVAYMHTDEWRMAGPLIEEALKQARDLNSLEYEIAAHHNWIIYHALAGNPEMVMSYTDSLDKATVSYNQRDRKQISESYRVRFDTERKEAQLDLQLARNEYLAVENDSQRRQRNVLLFLALTFIVLLFLLANRYQLRKKLAIEQEARLTGQLKVKELEKARKQAENELLEEQVQHRQRELASLTLQMAQKNDALEELESSIKKSMQLSQGFSSSDMKEVLHLIGNQKTIDKDWHVFKAHFEDVHPAFFEKLRNMHNTLSQTEEKHSAYMRMGMSTKEIARLMNISPSSVQVSRYRLKKKMALSKEEDIYQHINSI